MIDRWTDGFHSVRVHELRPTRPDSSLGYQKFESVFTFLVVDVLSL